MVVNGKKLADEILAELKKDIQKLPPPTAGAVLVGKNPAAESFLKQKARVAKFLGVNFKILRFGGKIGTEKLCEEILKLNKNKKISGIIVQLPLPKHIETNLVLDVISPTKDIDALSTPPLSSRAGSKSPKVLAPTVEAVKFVFNKYKVNIKNKNILIVGCGRLVGQPIYNWLTSQESYREVMMQGEIKIIDVKQKNQLPELAREADIIISGVGKAGLINGNMIKKSAILIDFGFSRKNGPLNSGVRKIFGDFHFESCAQKAKIITPVPGGMGPIMVAMLFKNLLKLSKL